MDIQTGTLYPSVDDGIAAGVPPHRLVEIRGTREQAEELSTRVAKAALLPLTPDIDHEKHRRERAEAARKRKAARTARRKNRRRG